MINVAQAQQIILDNSIDYGIEQVEILSSFQRILREDIMSDRDLPPYDRVTMDGICLAYDSIRDGNKALRINGIVAAGSPQDVGGGV